MRRRGRRLGVAGAFVIAACGGTTEARPPSLDGDWTTIDTIPGYSDIQLHFSSYGAPLTGTWSAVALRETGTPLKSGEAVGEYRGDSVIIRLEGFSSTFRGIPVAADSLHGRLVSGGGVSAAVAMYPERPFFSVFGFGRRRP